jgi:hypothetical protein
LKGNIYILPLTVSALVATRLPHEARLWHGHGQNLHDCRVGCVDSTALSKTCISTQSHQSWCDPQEERFFIKKKVCRADSGVPVDSGARAVSLVERLLQQKPSEGLNARQQYVPGDTYTPDELSPFARKRAFFKLLNVNKKERTSNQALTEVLYTNEQVQMLCLGPLFTI